jgi:glucose/arabinose dehydrogenase
MRPRILTGALGALTALAFSIATTAGGRPSVETIAVRLTDRGAVLSRREVEVGLVRFLVANTSRHPRRFAVAGKQTRFLKRGGRQALSVRFARAGEYAYAVSSKQGRIRRGTLDVRDTPAPPQAITLTKVGDFGITTDIDSPPGEDNTLVVAEQDGLVHLLVNGEQREKPFLDLRERVLFEGEGGLLSIAFAPDYAESGLLYAYYNDRGGNINIVEFHRAADDPESIDIESGRTLLYQVKFAPNHNGGMLQFGPDSRLYAAIGDGGSTPAIAPGELVQDPNTVWGKILRFDLASGRHETWAGGFRNPWRFWIDAVTGDAFVGDVGEGLREEIDRVPAGTNGLNFGWPCFEGTLAFDPAATCTDAVAPVYEYAHGSTACAVTGGVVAHDARLPVLEGAYLFSDLCGSTVLTLRRGAAGITVETLQGASVVQPTAFGVDNAGRIYVGSASGAVYRLDPSAASRR